MTVRKQTSLWTTREGRKVRLCDMGDQHLLNTIAMLRRQAERVLWDRLKKGWRFAATLRGDMAIDCAERELERIEEMDAEELLYEETPIYERLLLEAERRNIQVLRS
jgi:hypothetical protein